MDLKMILNDHQINDYAINHHLITPYMAHLKSSGVISFGLSSMGYDLRLSAEDFKIFKRRPGHVVDPKNFQQEDLESVALHSSPDGDYFIMPSNSYALGISVETLDLPNNIICIAIGKSTYARSGIIVNVTPIEPGWYGRIVLEFSNASASDCKIYANEGVCQLLFLKGEGCKISYKERDGKYYGQDKIVTPIVK